MAIKGTMKHYSGLIGTFDYDEDIFKVVKHSSECNMDRLIYIGPIEDGINIEIPKGCDTLTDTFKGKEFLCKHVSFGFNDVKYTSNIFMDCVFGGSITTMNVSKISYFDAMFEGATFIDGFSFPWDFRIPRYANYNYMFCGIKASIPFIIKGIENVLTGDCDGTLCKIEGLKHLHPGYDLSEDTYWDEDIIKYFSEKGPNFRGSNTKGTTTTFRKEESIGEIGVCCDSAFKVLYQGTGRTLNEVIAIMKDEGWEYRDIIKSELKILGDLVWE